MKYRRLGRTGFNVSEIGIGLEHLFKEEESVVIESIRAAIEGGVNYFDCFSIKDFEKSSDTNVDFEILGKAIEGKRDKLYLNFLVNSLHNADETDVSLGCFLKEVKTDYVDMLMIACCDKMTEIERLIGENSLSAHAQKLQAQGKVKYIGLSTHSTSVTLKAIESGVFDVLMYPVNPAFDVLTNEDDYIEDDIAKLWDSAHDYKTDEKAGAPRKDMFIECGKADVGLVAMKPYAAAWLFKPEINTGFTPVNLLSYALSQNNVATIVPGVSNPQHVRDMLAYNTASDAERDFSRAVAQSRWSARGNCLYCNHCLPCKAGIDIGETNRLTDNAGKIDHSTLAEKYAALPAKASSCVKCGECVKRCPFEVDVMGKLKQAVEIFE
ncbi:MAG: aldo/keto reductase [Defluviitaleaceae bacterium]|nr:aldo/keto reductase [Defluviitaleaceae bacterium]MCL2836937.1 aldo/keto reductase [Defluviitaleaceae bacterium]